MSAVQLKMTHSFSCQTTNNFKMLGLELSFFVQKNMKTKVNGGGGGQPFSRPKGITSKKNCIACVLMLLVHIFTHEMYRE